jgi:5-methyltetrahydropteroyltriglutamate--homocysteine methyltransferase
MVSLECAGSKVPMSLISLLSDKELMIGAIDVATNRVETPEEVASVLKAATKYASPGRIYGCSNCGLAPLPRAVAVNKLRALVGGAALLRKELSGK